MAGEYPRWRSERIRGELLKLGITVSKRSIQRYRRRGPAGPPSQTWRTFLANHRPDIWTADLFTVQTLTFRTLYVLLFSATRGWLGNCPAWPLGHDRTCCPVNSTLRGAAAR